METNVSTLPKKLRRIRAALIYYGIKQKRIAAKGKFDRSQISLVLTGKRKSKRVMNAILQELDEEKRKNKRG